MSAFSESIARKHTQSEIRGSTNAKPAKMKGDCCSYHNQSEALRGTARDIYTPSRSAGAASVADFASRSSGTAVRLAEVEEGAKSLLQFVRVCLGYEQYWYWFGVRC
jgi:hypothetical protein